MALADILRRLFRRLPAELDFVGYEVLVDFIREKSLHRLDGDLVISQNTAIDSIKGDPASYHVEPGFGIVERSSTVRRMNNWRSDAHFSEGVDHLLESLNLFLRCPLIRDSGVGQMSTQSFEEEVLSTQDIAGNF